MAKAYRPVNRDQPFLLAPDMREWLPPDHLVWFLLETLKHLDLKPFHARHRNDGAGRAAYDPDMLVALLIYAYCCGERSSRQIERLCQVNVAFRVVCAGDIPDHTKIARFRAVHQDAFEAVFAQVLAIAAKAGLAKFETVAIDGTKIAANASLDANRDEKWLREQVAKIVDEATAVDQGEDGEHGPDDRGDGVPPDIRDPSRRSQRITAAAAQLKAEQDAAAAARAPDAEQVAKADDRLERINAGQNVKGHHGGGAMRVAEARARLARDEAAAQAKLDAYAASAGTAQRRRGGRPPVPVENHHDVVAARRALAKAIAAQSAPTRRQAKRKHVELEANITDPDSRVMPTRRKGWIQGYNAQLAITADQVIVALSLGQNPNDIEQFIPMMRAVQDAAAGLHALTRSPDHLIGDLLADAGYPSDANLAAEGPPRLIALGKTRDQIKAAKTRPTQGDPPPDASPREAMDHRLRTPEGAKLYKRRGATVEPGIGNLKKLIDRFSRRGLTAALSELNLAATAFNLRKIHTATLA
jgi:transposase